MRIGYTRGEWVEMDMPRLAHCDETFRDSSPGWNRRMWRRLLHRLAPGDTLVVVSLMRIGNSIRELSHCLAELAEKEVRLISLEDGFDSTEPMDMAKWTRMMIEYDREWIRARTLKGMEKAQKNGRKGGRPQKMGRTEIRLAKKWVAEGKTLKEIAATLKVGRTTLYRYLHQDDD